MQKIIILLAVVCIWSYASSSGTDLDKENDRKYFAGNTELDRVLASSILPPTSPKCRSSNTTLSLFNMTMDFTSSKERSRWSPVNAIYEKDIFLLEMNITLPSRLNVTIRLGTGGNIYSHFIQDTKGPGKESIPPQAHESSPFNDEVWQFVSVNSQLNDRTPGAGHYKYFIHQAGTYLRDPEGGLGTSDNRTRAFSSPTVAYFCNVTEASCTVMAWGQHAHVPTIHRSNVLYTTRYVFCDDPNSIVLEVTNALTVMTDPEMSENGGGDVIDYMNVPWGGVRESTLRDVFISNPTLQQQQAYEQQLHEARKQNREQQRLRQHVEYHNISQPLDRNYSWLESILFDDKQSISRLTESLSSDKSTLLHKPLPGFGTGGSYDVVHDTGGYLTFAQRVYDPEMVKFEMPCVNIVTDQIVPCGPNFSAKQAPWSISLSLSHSEFSEKSWQEEDLLGLAFKLDHEGINGQTNTDDSLSSILPNQRKVSESGIIQQLKLVVSKSSKHPIRAAESPIGVPIDDRHASLIIDLEPTVNIYQGCLCILYFINKHTRERALVVGVWSWARGGKSMHLLTAEGGGDPVKAVDSFNSKFARGDEIVVEYVNNGMSPSKNMAVTWVMGCKYHPEFEFRPSTERVGATFRDYIVFEATNHITVQPGMTFIKRQYLLTGHLDESNDTAHKWLDEIMEQVSQPSERMTSSQETRIVLHSNLDATIVGVTVGTQSSCGPSGTTIQRCQGFAMPVTNTFRLFAIECGLNQTYIGYDLYHFSPSELDAHGTFHYRPYICDDLGSHGPRPRWKLLGYFPLGSCSSVEGAKFDSDFCSGPSLKSSSKTL